MEQVIKINVPKGKKAVYNETTQVIEFVNVEPIRSKSWKEFCDNHPNTSDEWYVNSVGDISVCGNSYSRAESCNNHLSSKEDAEGILALIQLTRLHDEWVEDWKGNYIVQDTTLKYQIVYSENKPCVAFHHLEHSLLDFPNEKIAKEFLDCFEDLILKAKKFI